MTIQWRPGKDPNSAVMGWLIRGLVPGFRQLGRHRVENGVSERGVPTASSVLYEPLQKRGAWEKVDTAGACPTRYIATRR